MRYLVLCSSLAFPAPVFAQRLAVPVIEPAGQGQGPSCGAAVVQGLREAEGGYLAIRTGPGTRFAQIGALRNGDQVWLVSRHGDWAGIAVQGGGTSPSDLCANPGQARKITGPDVGWVHGRWLRDGAR
ncbi:MAG: SH3 domain-containing protein [Paracoccus sp. (in: a-proteobacteria)]|uniref:SH3 domain-containing protein n=1 Tax=Paracoccus sp. TaxID=267 RepID=UPI0039E6A264